MTIIQINETVNLTDKIKKEVEMPLTFNEARLLYLSVISAKKIPGDIAEVGVYKGGSAKLICEVKEDRVLYLFDTFEGLPETSKDDPPSHYKGRYNALLENVQQYLVKYKNVYFYKGVFPATADTVKNKTFSLVHLDVDLYKSTLDCLNFFYPRMSKGGIILLHDYPNLFGVKKAVDEFFKDKPEPIIRATYNQCLIVKI
ncbi:hypothetical protein AMJ49_04400 [Parcubacteria bacterium DG_74_2]|nr:MAG: hypothetical protein AMJ49_04400 [Parcubacteria bacterium DG_74_2]